MTSFTNTSNSAKRYRKSTAQYKHRSFNTCTIKKSITFTINTITISKLLCSLQRQ